MTGCTDRLSRLLSEYGQSDTGFQRAGSITEEEDEETLAAIDRGIKDADEGRTVSLDEARKMIPKWISKFESRKRR